MSVIVKTLEKGFVIESFDGSAIFVDNLEDTITQVRAILSRSVSSVHRESTGGDGSSL
jgi:hypothetical protein